MTILDVLIDCGLVKKDAPCFSYSVYGPCSINDEPTITVYMKETKDAPVREFVINACGYVKEVR